MEENEKMASGSSSEQSGSLSNEYAIPSAEWHGARRRSCTWLEQKSPALGNLK